MYLSPILGYVHFSAAATIALSPSLKIDRSVHRQKEPHKWAEMVVQKKSRRPYAHIGLHAQEGTM